MKTMTTEVVRDEMWDDLYKTANPKDPEEIRIKFANALWRAKTRMDSIRLKRKERSIKILTEIPKNLNIEEQIKAVRKKTCQGITMTGKPCQFKAVSECGRFCKKHNVE